MLSIDTLVERGDEAKEGDGDLIAAFKYYEKALHRGGLEALKGIIDIGEDLNISFWDPLLMKAEKLVVEGSMTAEAEDELSDLILKRLGDDDFDAALQKLYGEVMRLDLLDECLETFHDQLVECCDASDDSWMEHD